MKRDSKQIHEILRELHSSTEGIITDDERSDEWRYNAMLLIQAGYVDGDFLHRPDECSEVPSSVALNWLTESGREYLARLDFDQ